MSDAGSPDWVRDALRQFAGEVRLFVRTAVDFTLHPSRFAVEWASGGRQALNPLGFLATAFAVVAPLAVLFDWLNRSEDLRSPLVALLAALGPFAYYLSLGAAQHGVLRLFGSRRPLRDSCAMALYAGGGPATAARVLVSLMDLVYYAENGKTSVDNLHSRLAWLVFGGAILSFAAFVATLGAALGGVHRRDGIRWWHILVANVVALALTGLVFGMLRPPGDYGLHLDMAIRRLAGHWHCNVWLED